MLNLTSNCHRRLFIISSISCLSHRTQFAVFALFWHKQTTFYLQSISKSEKRRKLIGFVLCEFSVKMVIYGVYIVSKSGGLIFNHDHNIPKIETEKVFNYPIDLKLEYDAKKVAVAFGQKDGINSWVLATRPLRSISINVFYISVIL